MKPKIDISTLQPIGYPHLELSAEQPILVFGDTYIPEHTGPLFDMHYALEMGIVLEGSIQRFVKGAQWTLGPGDLWTCGIWEPHGFSVSEAACQVMVLVIWPPLITSMHVAEAENLSWLAPFVHDKEPYRANSSAQRIERIELAKHLLALEKRDDAAARARMRLSVMGILLGILEDRSAIRNLNLKMPLQDDYARITPALEALFRSGKLVTSAQAAKLCAMSTSSFMRIFARQMAISFTQFELRHRLQQAAEQIAGTVQPIKAIANQWGFTDASHLHRLFQKHFGCSPSEYRKQVPGSRSRYKVPNEINRTGYETRITESLLKKNSIFQKKR
jgi:AraC-like DNA-binding protein